MNLIWNKKIFSLKLFKRFIVYFINFFLSYTALKIDFNFFIANVFVHIKNFIDQLNGFDHP